MTDASSSDQELINRYLAGRLTDAEALMIETRIVKDRAFRGEVELTAAFKEGIRELEKQQQLAPLLAARSGPWLGRWPLAIAALSLVAAISLSWFVVANRQDNSRDAMRTAALYFEHTRGSGSSRQIVWQRSENPVQLELHLDVGANPAATYDLTISIAGGKDRGPAFSSVSPTTIDGQVVADLDDSLLVPGEYTITLRPIGGAEDRQLVAYHLTVR